MQDLDQHLRAVNTQVYTDHAFSADQNLFTIYEIRRYRASMLQRVQSAWIAGLLEPSLRGTVRLPLRLQLQDNEAAEDVMRKVTQKLGTSAEEMDIVHIYDRAQGRLLISGEAGSGKTTLLLELAQALLQRASDDERQPIPVVFALSSWANAQSSIADWLLVELHTHYQIPLALAAFWLQEDLLLPLFDGLDEVAAPQRAACVQEINAYMHAHKRVSVVVSCQRASYLVLPHHLELRAAVEIRSVPVQQVATSLGLAGEHQSKVRRVLHESPELLSQARTPLLLNLLTIISWHDERAVLASPAIERKQILALYGQQALTRLSATIDSTHEQMVHWLSWLSRQMQAHQQTIFSFDQLQPDWLTNPDATRTYRRYAVLWPAILIGALSSLILSVLINDTLGVSSLMHLIIGGWLGALLSRNIAAQPLSARGIPSGKRTWQERLVLPGSGLLFGLSAALFSAPNYNPFPTLSLTPGPQYQLLKALCFGVCFACGMPWLQFLLRRSMSVTRPSPALPDGSPRWQRLISTAAARTGWLIGSLIGLSFGLSSLLAIGITTGLSYSLSFGLRIGLSSGLDAGLATGLEAGLAYTAAYTFLGWFIYQQLQRTGRAVHFEDYLSWSWYKLFRGLFSRQHLRTTGKLISILALVCLVSALVISLTGVSGSALYGLNNWASYAVAAGLGVGFLWVCYTALGLGLMYWCLFGCLQGLSGTDLGKQRHMTSTQIIHNGVRRGLVQGLICAFVILLAVMLKSWVHRDAGTWFQNWLANLPANWLHVGYITPNPPVPAYPFWVALISGFLTALCMGLLVGLLYGWLPTWRHYVLRYQLWRAGSLPRHLPRFLDAATAQGLLYRVGTGYLFRHSLVRDYFISLEEAVVPEARTQEIPRIATIPLPPSTLAPAVPAGLVTASSRQWLRRPALICLIILLIIGSLIGTTAGIMQFLPPQNQVTNLYRNGPGSLVNTMQSALDNSTITFAPGLRGTIKLAGTLEVPRNLTLRGPGANLLTISSDGQSQFYVPAGINATASGLTFKGRYTTNANSSWGMIFNSGTLLLRDCAVTGNTSLGGIYNYKGKLTLQNSTVSGNRGYEGGGITNVLGTVNIAHSTISKNAIAGNQANHDAVGGGFFNYQGIALIADSTITDNSAQGSDSDHPGSGSGGGVSNYQGDLVISNSTIANNVSHGVFSPYGGAGINSIGGMITVLNSTLYGNTVQGANGAGGGILIQSGNFNIIFCTIYNNSAEAEGGGVDMGVEISTQTTIENTLIASNHSSFGANFFGNPQTASYNLIGDTDNAIAGQATNIAPSPGNTSPLLIDSQLRNNGGPTQTLRVEPGSPVIGTIPLANCRQTLAILDQHKKHIEDLHISADQRGVARPQPRSNACTIGAYEY